MPTTRGTRIPPKGLQSPLEGQGHPTGRHGENKGSLCSYNKLVSLLKASPLRAQAGAYTTKCVERIFCEVGLPFYGFLRSSLTSRLELIDGVHLSEGLHPPDVGLGYPRERHVIEHLAHLLLGVCPKTNTIVLSPTRYPPVTSFLAALRGTSASTEGRMASRTILASPSVGSCG